MKNKKGRSALNSIGDGFGDMDVQQRVMITAVAAAASDPRRQMVKDCKATLVRLFRKQRPKN